VKVLVALMGSVVLLAACGGISVEPEIDATADPGQATETAVQPRSGSGTLLSDTEGTPTVAVPTAPPPGTVGEVDLVTYVEVMEDMLTGTAYAGEVLEAPEVFLATGALFCDQLDADMSPNTVLTQYIETLTGQAVDQAADDDLIMAGAVLGVGVVTLCPHHLVTLAASL